MSESAYENVVKGKLKLKGKALDVKGEGIFKKKKKHKITGGILDDRLTPSERRYLQHWEKIESQRLAKLATKSHRDRIQDFNQYLANLTEHYDIPKVGPG
ncbi:protein FAM32A-like isoform X2 [Mangifera indica]|uniref:protein FAM32A-like isoform X2 n=1 Tax=Mangifera indica TaxID=29780 RepID=UPI001CFB0E97|nr:protein FAM32A-like isoform X2 [Mangifera indica]